MSNHVLVLTRDDALGCALFETFRLWRYEPRVCAGPSEVLRAAADHPPVAVVTDTETPGVAALEVMAALRAHEATERAVLVAIVPTLRRDVLQLAAGVGCDRVCTRPVDADWVCGEVDRLFAARWARAA